MRAGREAVVGGHRNISLGGREKVEAAVRELVEEEAAAWRGSRRSLFLGSGYSSQEVEAALEELGQMEEELVAESLGVAPLEVEEPGLDGLVCPLCKGGLREGKGCQVCPPRLPPLRR